MAAASRATPPAAASVLLVEQNDLAAGTSSASTKLIHGGLRYLEHYEFRLVREALAEREVLLRMAPHLIWPMRFVLPASPGLRPAWLIRLGLFLYDHLGGRDILPATRTLDLTAPRARRAAQARVSARLRVFRLLGRRFAPGGAQCARCRRARRGDRTRTRCVRAGARTVLAPDARRGAGARVDARVLVNAAGPWVERRSARPCCVQSSRGGSGWSRAATSSCAGCSSTTAATSSRTPTAGSCSPSPMTGLHADRHHRRGLRRRPARWRRRAEEVAICAARSTRISATPLDPDDWSGLRRRRPLYDDGAARRRK